MGANEHEPKIKINNIIASSNKTGDGENTKEKAREVVVTVDGNSLFPVASILFRIRTSANEGHSGHEAAKEDVAA